MNRWLAICVLIAGFVATWSPAFAQEEEGREDIVFAVPDEGSISLGVFDHTGKMVRLLHRLAPQTDFRIGLNGLMTRWDGRDDAGQKLPAGTYHIRGYLVGEVEVTGEDFHFNDWIGSETDPRISRIIDYALLDGGDVVLLALDPEGGVIVARCSETKGFVWSWKGPAIASPLLAVDAGSAWVWAGRLNQLDLATGAAAEPAIPVDSPDALAAANGRFFSARGASISSWAASNSQVATDLTAPSPVRAMEARGERLGILSEGSGFVKTSAGAFQKLSAASPLLSLSLGLADTVWFVGNELGETFVAQVSPTGEMLRLLRNEPGDPTVSQVRAAGKDESIAVLDAAPGLQRLRVLSRGENWILEWERTLQEAPRFGFVEGQVVADAGPQDPPAELKIRLEQNPLNGQRDILRIHLDAGPSGVVLATPDGIPLADISSRGDIRRRVFVRGKDSDSLRILLGDGTVVEEFSVSGLKKILPLDVGDIQIP